MGKGSRFKNYLDDLMMLVCIMKTEEEKYYVGNNIKQADNRIILIINSLKNRARKNKIIIYFDHNGGGNVAIIKELIVAIDNCPSDRLIVLVFTGYAISAVAYLLAYFAFYSVTRKNIIVQAQGPLCLVYHKPRIKKYAVTLFANSLDSKNTYLKEVECMRKYTMNFDHIYDALEKACIKKGIEIAPHMKAIYNMNGDISVTFNGGPL